MSESQALVRIGIPSDDDGMVGCQCPQDACRPRYFKLEELQAPAASDLSGDNSDDGMREALALLDLSTIEGASPQVNVECAGEPLVDDFNEDESDEPTEANDSTKEDVLHCPYCGHIAHRQLFFTSKQIEYAMSLILRDFDDSVQQQLKQLVRSPDPHAFLSIGVSVQLGALPAIATYEENQLKQRVVCPYCQANYAVYGLSFVCPRCGENTLLWHLDSTAREIHAFLDMPADILVRLDPRSQEKLIEHALADVVTFWEGYLKALYRNEVRHRFDPDKAAELERQIGTTFQRLSGATERFAKVLEIDLLAEVSPDDVEVLTRVFNKRHVLTHNLGLVDEKFLAQTHMQQQVGQEIEVTREETAQALDIVSQVLRRADEQTRATH